MIKLPLQVEHKTGEEATGAVEITKILPGWSLTQQKHVP
jgi:hypothetical protein